MSQEKIEGKARFEAYCAAIDAARMEYAVPGVGVGVLFDGEEYTAGFGVTNINHPLMVDSDTLFQIGSTTKTYTATLAMMLVEEGKLNLDAPIRTWLPDFKLADEDAAARVTLRDLFTHHGGWIGDFFEDTGRGDDALDKYVEKMVELRQENPLGATFAYNNAGFNLAGLIIQKVTGKIYEDVLRERILEPLGMTLSRIFPDDVIVHRTASGHFTPVDGEATVAEPWGLPRSAYPAGGILSTAKDQLKYARFHLGDGTTHDGTRLLKQETVRMMQETQRKAYSLTDEVGISWLIRNPAPGIRVVAHGGATTGQYSAFEMVPDRGFALALTTNGSRGRSFNSQMVKKALEIFLDAQLPKPEAISLSDEELQEYAGVYRAELAEDTITSHAGGLLIDAKARSLNEDRDPPPATPPGPFVFTGKDVIQALEGSFQGSKGEFSRNGDGKIRWLHLGGRIYHRA